MKTKLRKHLTHAAKSAGVPVFDLLDVWEVRDHSIAVGVDKIYARAAKRKPITKKVARQRYDATDAVIAKVQSELNRGEGRRARARVSGPLSIRERKIHAIRNLVGGELPGSFYSGDTSWNFQAVTREETGARTRTEHGEQYSRKCTFHKTDAVHTLKICLSDLIAARRTPVPATVDGELVIRAAQVRDGVYEATTIATVGKAVESKRRFIADQGDGCWYLGNTERGAVTALNRSRRTAEAARLGKVNAAICKSWGWCASGIVAWCKKHGIHRDLRSRLQQGTSSAAIARLIAKHGGPRNSYEQRLLQAAGK